MVGKTGFEPATPWSQTKCSTKLSHFPIYGAPNRSRTHNLLIRSQTLYPIELWAHMFITNKITCAQNYIFKMVASVGIEPTTPRFSVLCSANWAMKPKWMAVPTGIEPAIPRVTGECDNRYTTEPFGCRRWIWTTGLWVMSPTSYRTAPSRDINQIGGGKGIRTPAPLARPSGFQDRSLQPDLGIPPKWCLRSDLNRHEGWISQDFKSCASTYSATEAQNLVSRWRFDLQTPWLKVKCSTDWASETHLN